MKKLKQALEAAHLIDRLERLSRSADARTGLNPAQWEALRYVACANRFSRSPAALADYLNSTRGTVSQTLIALEDKGFIARKPNVKDRRSVELVLTDAGQIALAKDPLIDLAHDIAADPSADVETLVVALRAALRQTINRMAANHSVRVTHVASSSAVHTRKAQLRHIAADCWMSRCLTPTASPSAWSIKKALKQVDERCISRTGESKGTSRDSNAKCPAGNHLDP